MVYLEIGVACAGRAADLVPGHRCESRTSGVFGSLVARADVKCTPKAYGPGPRSVRLLPRNAPERLSSIQNDACRIGTATVNPSDATQQDAYCAVRRGAKSVVAVPGGQG